MKRREKVLALVLAGGSGSRLGVLTARRAKPALPYAGTLRLIDFPLSNCLHSGLSDVWVIEQYQLHTLNDHLANGRPWDLDRTYGGLQVLPPSEERSDGEQKSQGFAEGNADAIHRHRALIREFAPDLIVVLSADHVYKLDYRDVLDRHRQHGGEVTVVTTLPPPGESLGRFGVVEVDAAGRITGFQYKPAQPRGHLVSAEVFVYSAPKLLATLERLLAEDGKLEDYGHALLPRLVEEGRAWEHRLEGYWRDVGTVESYWQSHMDLLASENDLALDEEAWPILTYSAQRLPARVQVGAEISESLVGPGCRVAGCVRRSVLSPGVVVEAGAVVEDSILLRDARIEAGARVCRTVVDEEAVLGAGAHVGGAGALTLVGAGRRVESHGEVAAGEQLPPAEDEVPGHNAHS